MKNRFALSVIQGWALLAQQAELAKAVECRNKEKVEAFALACFAAVEAHGKAANFAQAEFISAEHFN